MIGVNVTALTYCYYLIITYVNFLLYVTPHNMIQVSSDMHLLHKVTYLK